MITPIPVPLFAASMQTRVPKHRRGISVMEWVKGHGAPVTEGELIVVLHTRKAAVEMAAEASGLLFHLKEINEMVDVGDVLGVLADSAEEFEQYKRRSLVGNVA